jgi:antitoxin component of MazEF toxin-antitoxin module
MYNVITMKASIITIGNSKGIRIPKPLLEESGLKETVDIKAKRGEIRITPGRHKFKKNIVLNEEYLMSLSALSDWNSPEEDRAWAHLQ